MRSGIFTPTPTLPLPGGGPGWGSNGNDVRIAATAGDRIAWAALLLVALLLLAFLAAPLATILLHS